MEATELNRNTRTLKVVEDGCVMTRVFDAPRELVFEVWTSPEHLSQWWGPSGFTNTFEEFDMRPGGTWRFIMHGPDGVDYQNHNEFVEVVRPERIVFQHQSDPKFQATVSFEELDGKTKLTYSTRFVSAAVFDQVKSFAIPGGEQTLDRLEAHLVTGAAGSGLVITRTLDAPRELVFRAWTDPNHLKHWWGPAGFDIGVIKLDLSPGGVFHYSMRSPDGQEMWGKFAYREIVAPEKIVFLTSSSP